MAQLITSRQNPKIKALLQLRKHRERERLGLMLVEGFDELSVALEAGLRPTEIYYCPDLMASRDQLQLLQHRGLANAEPFELNRDAFERAAYREGADGWLAVGDSIQTDLAHIRLGKNPLVIVCEAVEKPGNLGAILRTADAAGADAVIAADASTDWSNPNIVRASKGAVFAVPVATASSEQVKAWLDEHKIATVALTPDTKTLHTNADLSGPVALLAGTEKFGLSDFWLDAASQKVRIPMVGTVDSLNVSIATAIVTYEAIRQRGV